MFDLLMLVVHQQLYKKLSYRLLTARRESQPKIAEVDVEMTT